MSDTQRERRCPVVVDAVRTPFVKSYGPLEEETTLSLSTRVVSELVNRNGIKPSDIDEVAWGIVISSLANSNIARDVVVFSGLPSSIPAYTVTKACVSSLHVMQTAGDAISTGRIKLAVVGGVEVMSRVPLFFTEDARRFFTKLSRLKTPFQMLGLAFGSFKPRMLFPAPVGLTESATGFTMGEHAEQMAQKNGISRTEQDEYTVRSHRNAAAAMAAGHFNDEIVPVCGGTRKVTFVDKDNIVRPDSSLEDLAKLRPAFDKKYGTVTAASSSALTDGASGVLLADEEYARSHKLPILGRLVASENVAVDPNDQLLNAPAYAIPRLLARAGLKMEDVGVYEIHEAFAAQVLSCLKLMADETFCREKVGLPGTFGLIPMDRVNIDGGSLALGHPLAASGGRLVSRALRIAKRVGSRYAVVSACAAGAQGEALLFEIV